MVNRYCLTSQGLQRNTLLHAVAQAIGTHSSPCSQIIDSLKQSSANNDIANRAPPTTPHPTDIHLRSPPTTSPQSPLLTTSRRNNPPKKSPLRPRSHRPRPPRPGQKQSNHTFPLPGSRGCVCLSGGSRYNNNFFSEILVTSELGYTISFLFLQKNEP